jgi:cystathionine gamma-synthase
MNREGHQYRGDSTRAVHGGEERLKFAQSLINPIAQTATYVFSSLEEFEAFKAGEKDLFEYGRYGNPTQRAAERKIAALENAQEALLFSSGMSAVTSALLAMLRSGQHLVVMEDCYRMTAKFCALINKFGVASTLVKPGDLEGLEQAVRPETRLIFTESPTNPHLHVLDLEKLVAFARQRRLKVIIDSTLATPVNQRPLDFGVDLVIHSATKYLGGHNDLMAGAICGPAPLVDAIREYQRVTGAVVDPHTAYLLIRGLKTLALRVERQNATALEIARFLEKHPRVRRVYYPGLQSHPDHEVAKAQMRGWGGLISFEINGDLGCTRRFIHALKVPYLAPSLGGVETLVSHPATVSYYDLSPEQRLAIGIKDELVRYAVGIEEAGELIADLEEALRQI